VGRLYVVLRASYRGLDYCAQLLALSSGVPKRPGAWEVLPRRTPEMGIIDWDQPPRVVHDWVRALTARAHSPCFVVIG
jgi:methionyl-tRNA formyltransferase